MLNGQRILTTALSSVPSPRSLSEFSDENMMEPYNLAICFGPTLLPIPESKDQVQYQNLVNELMKHIILCHEEIFAPDGGPVYEKYPSQRSQQSDEIGEAPSDVSGGAADGGDGDTDAQSEDGEWPPLGGRGSMAAAGGVGAV